MNLIDRDEFQEIKIIKLFLDMVVVEPVFQGAAISFLKMNFSTAIFHWQCWILFCSKYSTITCVNLTCRSSHQRFPVKKGVLTNFTKFTEKHLCQRLQTCALYYFISDTSMGFIYYLRPSLQTTSAAVVNSEYWILDC